MHPASSAIVRETFRGKRCLVTGGLGFIGSNLAIELVKLGAKVTIIDNLLPQHGGNLFNIEPVGGAVEVNFGDISSESVMAHLVAEKDFVFHLAGQVSHVLSMSNPFPDIEINVRGTAVVMEAVKHHNPRAIVVYTGTRGQYGSATKLPVNEDAPMAPKGIYELTNLTAERIIQIYSQNFRIRSVLLRLTNIYGPRAQMRHSHFGVVNWFVRQILDEKPIQVFGDGSILRDFVYVDDAVEACLLAAARSGNAGEVFNVGDDRPTSFLQLVKLMLEVAGRGTFVFTEFSPERKAQEPGHFYSDIARARKDLGWEPRTPLDAGLRRTLAYYEEHWPHYWSKEG